MEIQQKILDFISKQTFCVIGYVTEDGRPQSAMVGFGQTEILQLIIGTTRASRKYTNIKRDNRVSISIGFEAPITVQYEGIARELEGEEAEKYSEIYYHKSEGARRFKGGMHETYFLIEPKWVRYTDVSKGPGGVEEVEF